MYINKQIAEQSMMRVICKETKTNIIFADIRNESRIKHIQQVLRSEE